MALPLHLGTPSLNEVLIKLSWLTLIQFLTTLRLVD